MAEYKSIQEIQNELDNLLTSDPGGFANKIDKFDYNEIADSLSSYWNNSVKELYDTLKEIIPSHNWNNTYDRGHNAGYSFENSPYVFPNINELGENYRDARNDEIESVLKNQDNLDYTIGDYKELTNELQKYMTRLLMPQYERRVEIEDLNRNFWVIGQNLTALNKIVLDIGDDFINKLIGELTGLWDNVYRIWQALFSLNDKIYSISDNEKVRFMMAYGFNQNDESAATVEAITFNKENAYQYGILPYICKEQIVNSNNEVCYAYYMPYNRRLDNVLIEDKSQEELLTDFNVDATGFGLIKMDCRHTNRNIEKMLKTIRERNFVLFAKSKEDLLPYLNTTQYPLLTALDFYRDYLYYVMNADSGNPLSTLIKDTSIWKQGGYLQYIDFIENSDRNDYIDTSRVSGKVIGAFSYVKSLFKDTLDLTFVNSVARLHLGNTIEDLKNIINVAENHDIDILISDLYKLFVECQRLIDMTPQDYSDNDGTEQEPQYTINTQDDTFVNDFIVALRDYEKRDSLDGNGTYQTVSETMNLPYINWDLLSMTSERIEDINTNFGQSYLYKYSVESKEDHLWIDFVANINRDSYIENGRSTIGSYTANDLRTGVDKDDLFYDLNITIPLNKSASSNTDIPKYIDFVRLGQPYPNIFLITDNASTSNNLNDIKHLNSLNVMDNWIGYQGSNSIDNYYYCIDGFYPFSIDGYKSINKTDNLISGGQYENYQLSNMLTYNIASSDLIDCRHTNDGSGQTRINNKHNFENPVVNLRFINGRTDSQEIEIVITKDATKKDIRKAYERFYEVTSVTIDNLDEQYDVFLGPYGKQGNASNNPYPNGDNPEQHIFGSVGAIANKSAGEIINLGNNYDLLYSYYSGNKYYYRIRTHSHSSYTHMAKLKDSSGNLITGTTLLNGTNGHKVYNNNNVVNDSFKLILPKNEAIDKAAEVLTGDKKYCIVLKNIYNRVSTEIRSKNQMASIYIGSLVKKEGDNIVELGQLNKLISASTLSTYTDREYDRVIFAQEEYGGVSRLYGHITPYKTKANPSIGDINSWGWSIVAQTFLPEVSSSTLKGEGYVCLIDAVQAIDALNPNFIVNTSSSNTVVEQLNNELKRLYPKGLVDINKPKDPNNLKLKDYVYLWIPFTIDETAETKIVINEEKIKWANNFRRMSKETTGWWYSP